MNDPGFWTLPPDRMVHGGGCLHNITVVQPPFTVRAEELPPNDPAAARARSAQTGRAVPRRTDRRPGRGGLRRGPHRSPASVHRTPCGSTTLSAPLPVRMRSWYRSRRQV
ncbi:DUF6333 family protein [Streptomyces sp. NPDC058773]|uniref:DUF6333 family protein n=1 Tax=Streptomyces sp. NPDC058773 TaxID=3346632 RepID=UPI003683DC01